MKKFITLLFISLILISALFSYTYAKSLKYENIGGHYSFLLPNGWEEIPEKVIIEYRELMQSEYEIEIPEYVAGFHLIEKDYFEFPYILVQEFDRGDVTYEEMASVLQDEDIALEVMEDAVEDVPELISDISLGGTMLDNEKYRLYMVTESDTPIGEMKSLGVIYFGRDTIVHLFFYSDVGEFDKDLPKYQVITDFFKFEKNYQYVSGSKTKEQTEKYERWLDQQNEEIEQDQAIQIDSIYFYTGIGAIIAILVAVIVQKPRKTKKK